MRTLFYSYSKLNTKSRKAKEMIAELIDTTLTNGYFNKSVDYNLLRKVVKHLSELEHLKP